MMASLPAHFAIQLCPQTMTVRPLQAAAELARQLIKNKINLFYSSPRTPYTVQKGGGSMGSSSHLHPPYPICICFNSHLYITCFAF